MSANVIVAILGGLVALLLLVCLVVAARDAWGSMKAWGAMEDSEQ